MRYINYNGNIFKEHEPVVPVSNRGFKYGDGFFESMVMFNKKIPLIEYHFSRAAFTAEVLSCRMPEGFDEDFLEEKILDLASVNDGMQNGRVRLQFFRKGGGMYLPDSDELGYSITIDDIQHTQFDAGPGLVIGMREDCYKPVAMNSDLKHSSAMEYIMAAQFARAENWDEMILINHYAQVCEALSSNVFIVKDNVLITPDLDSGCVNGVMRSYIIGLMDGVVQERDVEIGELETADEILLTNAVRGIQWVKNFKSQVYQNKRAMEITALLNKNLLGI